MISRIDYGQVIGYAVLLAIPVFLGLRIAGVL